MRLETVFRRCEGSYLGNCIGSEAKKRTQLTRSGIFQNKEGTNECTRSL